MKTHILEERDKQINYKVICKSQRKQKQGYLLSNNWDE